MSAPFLRATTVVLALLCCLTPGASTAAASSSIQEFKERGVLLWGSDSEGGAPYVFPDPKDPSKLIGFELDIAVAVAK
jgi:polar amino acid transport system substrate-binding protein